MYSSLLTFVLVVTITAFLTMGYDKAISMNARTVRRIPEKTLFTLALLLGAVGIYLGMLTFRHKTRKWYFQIGIPLLILLNVVILYIFREFLIVN
jgi:uncharacterized membrane protein YsdA (DUF1294 family)